jgi:flagellar basal body-associated protein FliL
MSEQQKESPERESRKKRGALLWILIALLMGSNGVTLWLYLKEKNKVAEQIVVTQKIYVERENIQGDLLALQREYAGLKTNDAALQKEIDEKKAYIEQLLIEAKKHKGDAYIIAKLKKETETLREIMQGYVRTIDSLGTLNQNLRVEKEHVLKQLDAEKGKITDLNKEKEELKSTIEKGSVLTCFNVLAKAVKFKGGGKKESETSKAKRAQKIKVSFTLGENKIAKAGEKTVFVRIVTPDGKEMAKNYDDNYRFTFNKSSGYFAGKETLNYANVEISGVLYCEGMDPLVPGNYIIEVTCDGVVIGNTTLKLD